MIKKINFGSDLYFDRANEYNIKEDNEIIQDLKDTINSIPDRVFLCANEIGEDKRAFAIKFGDEVKVFSNPVYQERDKLKLVREKDYHTEKEFIIPRYDSITICYQDEEGDTKATKFNEDASPVICQAMDCLDGIHPTDYGLEIIPEFDEASEEERTEVIQMYINSIKDFDYTLDKDLSEDEEVKGLWKNFKFNRAVSKGEVQLEKEEQPTRTLNRKERRLFDKLSRKFSKKGNKSYVS